MLKVNLRQCFIAVMVLLMSQASMGAGKQPFSQELFEKLQSENKVILVDIFASWCSTCAKQQKVMRSYLEKHPERELHVLTVDFDEQKEVVKQFRAPRQSTMLLYKGDKQFWFAVAEVREDVITAEIEKAFEFKQKK